MRARNSALDLEALVLNADARPLSTWPLSKESARDAITAVMKGNVEVVDTWDAVIRTPRIEIPVPKVIMLRYYAPIRAEPKFCRASVFLRDRFKCQYCGEPFPREQLTYDHVIPRTKGGQTVWENILTCCETCNALKRDRPANWSGRRGAGEMRPLKAPRRPSTAELLRAGLDLLDQETRETWGDWLYWNAELKA
jgi:5-methylcytosine-specific restriction endonuclease McrA